MDYLRLNNLSFPVCSGSLSRSPDIGHYCWAIEIRCGPSSESQNGDRSQHEQSDHLIGTEPILYAQMLPLRVSIPTDLVGRKYAFPQTPQDDPPGWPEGIGWPFFTLYTLEHDHAYPIDMTITERDGDRYRVEIVGEHTDSGVTYVLRLNAWLAWQRSLATPLKTGLP